MRTRPAGLGRRAHPRSRGENRSLSTGPTGRTGSSPLTRGKPRPEARTALDAGLIPAHAGKTGALRLPELPDGAHPRSRGENTGDRGAGRRLAGSSPLTRGKRHRRVLVHRERGLIPAHAGKTRRAITLPAPSRAHPRSRGENSEAGRPIRTSWGSSPLTRGKHVGNRVRCSPLGLIPAHAGKTRAVPRPADQQWAHPRSRGENSVSEQRPHERLGSSPLTRGKPMKGHV